MCSMNRLVAMLAALFFATALAAQTAPPRLSAAQAAAVKSVIQAQLSAFAADDAKRAFSFAATTIQAQFQTPENFMAMVRAGYPMVYRPASVAFLKPELQDGIVIQKVHMTDQQGKRWLALYSLPKARSGNWRIGGCIVLQLNAQTT